MTLERSPFTMAERVLVGLEKLMAEANKSEQFSLLCMLCDETGIDGDDVIEMFNAFDEQDELLLILLRIGVEFTLTFPAITFAKQALREKNLEIAWVYAAEANYWHGIVGGMQDGGSYLIKNRALAAAKKRHEENHQIKADALRYYVENIATFKSKDNAAEQIAGKIVNVSFRTVRQWITDHHKKLRSASKP